MNAQKSTDDITSMSCTLSEYVGVGTGLDYHPVKYKLSPRSPKYRSLVHNIVYKIKPVRRDSTKIIYMCVSAILITTLFSGGHRKYIRITTTVIVRT